MNFDLAFIHVYKISKLASILKKFHPYLIGCNKIVITSASSSRQLYKLVEVDYKHKIEFVDVGNDYFDWSGFLYALDQITPDSKALLINDTVVGQRRLSASSLRTFFDAAQDDDYDLLGEVDMSESSLVVNGRSSYCWVSSFMFVLNRVDICRNDLLLGLEEGVVPVETLNEFKKYLKCNRPHYNKDPIMLESKIATMVFERMLSEYILMKGYRMKNAFPRFGLRRVERLFER